MKKISIVFVTLFMSVAMFGQDFKVGVRAGANFARFQMADFGISPSGQTRLDAALLAEMKINNRFSLQAEVGYSGYGTQIPLQNDKGKYTADYITIPLLAKFNTVEGLSVFGGVQAGILMKAESEDEKGDKDDIKQYLESTDFFGVIGVEYTLPAGIFVSARYNHGLTDIAKQDELKIRNRSGSIAVGYRIAL